MSEIRKKYLKISKGQISKQLIERTDIGILDSSGQEITNFYNSKYGALKTASGTTLKYTFGQGKKIKLCSVRLNTNEQGVLCFNGTDHTMLLFDHTGTLISNVVSISQITVSNVDDIVLAQNDTLILIATGDNPIFEIDISNLPAITYSVFDIPMRAILKTNTITTEVLNPIVYRFSGNAITDITDAQALGIEVGDYVILNTNTSWTPPTTFPWQVYQLVSYGTPDTWTALTPWTPTNLDTLKDLVNNNYYQYVQASNTWVLMGSGSSDIALSGTYSASATTGVVSITLSGANFVITAPAGLTPQNYAQSLLIGVHFDGGNNGIGYGKIIGITGTASGQNFTITKLQVMCEISFAGTSSYSGAIVKLSETACFSGNYPNTASNPLSFTNYPTNILFYQQRLIIAGTRYLGSQMVFSSLGKYDEFIDEGYSSSAFQLIIGSNQKETIRRVCLNQGIQIFTDVAEWLMSDTSLTRTSGFVRNSTIGTNGTDPVLSANGVTLFVPKNGKGIIGFVYNLDAASYMTPYISLFTDVLDTEIKDLCLKRGLDSQDDTLLFVTTKSGKLVIGNYLQDHDIQAFCVRSSDTAVYKQSMQAEQNVLFLVERNGYTTLELADSSYSSCSMSSGFLYNNTTGLISSLPNQYNGQTINVYDNNRKFVEAVSVVNNQATLSVTALPTSLSEVGFNIHSAFLSNPMNINQGTMTLYKSIQSIKLVVTEESKTDYLKVSDKFGWKKDQLLTYIRPERPQRKCQFTMTNDIYPCEVLSMEVTLEY